MKIEYCVILFFILTIFLSCRKDAVEEIPPFFDYPDSLLGEASVLVGTWNWINTEHQYNWCYGNTQFEVLDSASESAQYKFTLYEDGQARTFTNNVETNHYGLYLETFGVYYCPYLAQSELFNIKFNKNSNLELNGCISGDTLVIYRGYPFYNYEEGCEDYLSLFVRE